MKRSIIILALAAFTIFSTSCKKKEAQPTNPGNTQLTEGNKLDLIQLGETYISGASAKAVIYSTKELETGYNEIYAMMYDSVDGSALSKGHFDILPIMDMGSMQHGSPVENSEDGAIDGYFKSNVVFSMAGGSKQWSLELSFHNHKNDKEGTGKLGVNVKASSPSKFKSTVVTKDDNSSVYISLINPLKPAVGINDFEIVLHKRINTMEYQAIDDYTVEIEPVMPSMGHGSPNNVNPALTSDGHYKGKVNFTMSGLWQIKLKLFKNGVLISEDQFFEVTI